MSATLAEATAAALTDYEDAARAAGVTVRTLHQGEFSTAAAVMVQVWGEPSPMSTAILTALDHVGSYVAGAFQGDVMVGVTSGFFGSPTEARMHSHVAAVGPGTTARGIGTAMKLHQRWWCLERGVAEMTWTFDPLIARNAAFNVRRLGAELAEYKPNFYGEMNDGVNAGQGSDRVLASWHLASPLPETPREIPAGTPTLLAPDDAQRPVRTPLQQGTRAAVVRVPADIEALRGADAALGASWRVAVRETMLGLWGAGWRPTAVARDGAYLMELV